MSRRECGVMSEEGPPAVPFGTEYDKFQELVVYIADRCGEHEIGDTKLNKILAFSDFIAFAKFGHAITGAEYRRYPQGPLARPLLPARDNLAEDGAVEIYEEQLSGGKKRRVTKALRQAHTEVFDAEELALVDDIIERVKRHSAADVSEASHRLFAAWENTPNGESIPYETIFINTRPPEASRMDEIKKLAASRGWAVS